MTKTALRAEPLEIVEDLEPIRGHSVRTDQPIVEFENVQWRYVRHTSPANTIEVYVGSPQSGPAAKYRRAFSGWLEAKIYFGGPTGSLSGFAATDPESVVGFFEGADSHQFARFCGLIQTKLLIGHVADRVRSLATLIAIPWKSFQETTPMMSGFELGPIKTMPALQLPGFPSTAEPIGQVDPKTQLAKIEELMKSGRVDDSLDLLYSWIDELLRNGRYTVVDSLFKLVDKQTAPIDLIVGLLIATVPVKRRARSRASFLHEAKRAIEDRGESEEGLFDGLE